MNGLALYGNDLFGDVIKPKPNGPIAERFTFPPFTLIDARGGEWQERKRSWYALGLRGETGRKAMAYSSPQLNAATGYDNGKHETSVFDPVICELAYRWFSPNNGQIVDPFAGGSVRGIVAGALERRYWGCDLRPEQIEANEIQADEIQPAVRPIWVCGTAWKR